MKRALALTVSLGAVLALAQCGGPAPIAPKPGPVMRVPATGNGDDPPVIISNASAEFSTPGGWTPSGSTYLQGGGPSKDTLFTVYLLGGNADGCNTAYSNVTTVTVGDKDGYSYTLTLSGGNVILTPVPNASGNTSSGNLHGHRLEFGWGSWVPVGGNYVTQIGLTLQAGSGPTCKYEKNDDPIVPVVPHT